MSHVPSGDTKVQDMIICDTQTFKQEQDLEIDNNFQINNEPIANLL